MYGNSTTSRVGRKDDKGFTLIEILIAIVLIGILSAVAVVGISSLVSKGSTSACSATLDSSKAASAVYFASHSNTYPINFKELTTATAAVAASGAGVVPVVLAQAAAPAALTLPAGVVIGPTPFNTLVSGNSWTLTGTFGTVAAPAAPIFDPCP